MQVLPWGAGSVRVLGCCPIRANVIVQASATCGWLSVASAWLFVARVVDDGYRRGVRTRTVPIPERSVNLFDRNVGAGVFGVRDGFRRRGGVGGVGATAY